MVTLNLSFGRRKTYDFALLPSKKEAALPPKQHFNAHRPPPIVCSLLAVLFFGLCWYGSQIPQPHWNTPPAEVGRLHFVAPATSSKLALCQLILSAVALGYPTPTLANWGVTNLESDGDPELARYKSHLAKVKGVHDYLTELLNNGGSEDDLVLIIDGYDVWLQLGPDVMLKRYFEVVDRLDKQARNTFGEEVARARDMRHTVLFGPDKRCWPNEDESPGCWAVPIPDMDPYSYGPHTTNLSQSGWKYNLPRWLNSGNILGPVKDVRKMFGAALERIEKHYGHAGDQYYFNQLYGLQSHARLRNNPELLREMQANINEPREEVSDAQWPANDELHMAIDFGSQMFQHIYHHEDYSSWKQPSLMRIPADATADERKLQAYYYQPLPIDIRKSKPPFHFLPDASLRSLSWEEVTVLQNTATHTIPVLLHFSTRKNDLMLEWWEKLWFQSNAKALREARTTEPPQVLRLTDGPVGGKIWYASGPNIVPGTGTWSDKQEWLTWEDTCGSYEEQLFGKGE